MQFEVDRFWNESVWLWGQDGHRIVLGGVTREALEDDTESSMHNLTPNQLMTLARANIKAINQVLNVKLDAGQVVTPPTPERPRVILRSGDFRAAGVTLSATILGIEFIWA